MSSYARRGDLAGPVLLMGFGLLLFLINTGQVPLTLWEALGRLWPLALVAIGIDLLIPRRSILGSLATAAVILVVVLAGTWIAMPTTGVVQAGEGETVAVASSGETEAVIQLVPATGRLTVEEMVPAKALLAGTIQVPSPGSVSTTTKTEGGVARATIRTAGSFTLPINWGVTERWDLQVSGEPKLTLETDMGAGDTVVDARGMDLLSFNGSTGVGRIEIYVPEGTTRVDLSTGVGELVVHVPKGVPVRLRGSWALGGVDFPDGYYKVNETYLSPDFTEPGHIEINVSLAVGSIRILEY